MDDTALVEGLRRGDPRAAEHVVRQYAPALYRFAYYQLQDVSAAEDLVSDVMARMIVGVGGFAPGQATFQTWLFRIARNLIADHYRARQRHPQLSLDAMLDSMPEAEPGRADPQIEILPDRQELQAALLALTGEQRQVIQLHVIEGWELPQVASLLDRTVPSVKSLYYRGVRSLRRILEGTSPEVQVDRGG